MKNAWTRVLVGTVYGTNGLLTRSKEIPKVSGLKLFLELSLVDFLKAILFSNLSEY
jgi:hypothetical protein